MSVTLKLRRSTAAGWASADPVLSDGELGLETDTSLVKVGNGTSSWTALPYIAAHQHQDLTYTWTQSTPASTWTIAHNLGEYLNATVVTSSGAQVEGDVTFQDANTIVIEFASAFSGKAHLS